MQQKFDLTNINVPPFSWFVKWFAVGAVALLASAAVSVSVTKFFLFPELQIGKSSAVSEADEARVDLEFDKRFETRDFDAILKRNIFNSDQVDESQRVTATQSAQCAPVKSDLPLRFTGVIFGGSKETSLVLLESTATKQADTFLYNDVVPGEARIVDIERDKVFFERSESSCREYLDLQQPEVVKKRVPGVARSHSQVAGGGGADGLEFSESGFTRSKDGRITADRRWVDKALTTDFAKTLQDAKASPNLVNGEIKGFVLTRIRPDSVYEKMGFQDGDVVETINGIDLNDAARAIQTLNSLRQENAIELNVKRNGVMMPLKIQVR